MLRARSHEQSIAQIEDEIFKSCLDNDVSAKGFSEVILTKILYRLYQPEFDQFTGRTL